MATYLHPRFTNCVVTGGYHGDVIDVQLLRDQPDLVKASQEARGNDPATVDAAVAADVARREALQQVESLRAEQKAMA